MSRTLRPRPWKWLGILLLCLGFCVIAVLMLRDGRALGWLCLTVFGLGSLIAAIALLPGANYLRLEQEGFTFCSLFRAHSVRWDDVAGFGLVRVASNEMVGWLYREGRQPQVRGVRMSLALAGCHAALPETTACPPRSWRGVWNCCAWLAVMAKQPWNFCSPRASALRASSR
ncbi:STM3941 family protein [Pseudomonas sp. BMS12]|uniref:STM3941 family protein n=1 Tax=Pseudomonas sp. BMS12 TaxID=1796033 RepID=UPI00083AAA31|nr:STM3941 family protein [Pseudomonas sp. BMS12]